MLKWKRSVCRRTKWNRHQSDWSSQKMYNYNKQRSRLSNLKEVCGSWCSWGKCWACYMISMLPDWLNLGSVKFQSRLEFNTVSKVARHTTAYLLWWNICCFQHCLVCNMHSIMLIVNTIRCLSCQKPSCEKILFAVDWASYVYVFARIIFDFIELNFTIVNFWA